MLRKQQFKKRSPFPHLPIPTQPVENGGVPYGLFRLEESPSCKPHELSWLGKLKLIFRNCVTAFQKLEGGVSEPCWEAAGLNPVCPAGRSPWGWQAFDKMIKLSWFLGPQSLCHCKVSWMDFKRKVTLYSGWLFQLWCLCYFRRWLPFHKLLLQWHSDWPKPLGLGSVHMYKSKKCLYSFHRPFLLLTEDSVSKWLCFTLCLIFFFFLKEVRESNGLWESVT